MLHALIMPRFALFIVIILLLTSISFEFVHLVFLFLSHWLGGNRIKIGVENINILCFIGVLFFFPFFLGGGGGDGLN